MTTDWYLYTGLQNSTNTIGSGSLGQGYPQTQAPIPPSYPYPCPGPHMEVRIDHYVVLNIDTLKVVCKGVVIKQGGKEVVVPIDEMASKVGLEW